MKDDLEWIDEGKVILGYFVKISLVWILKEGKFKWVKSRDRFFNDIGLGINLVKRYGS